MLCPYRKMGKEDGTHSCSEGASTRRPLRGNLREKMKFTGGKSMSGLLRCYRAGILTCASVGLLASCAKEDVTSANKEIVSGYMEEIFNNGNYEVAYDYFPSDGFTLWGKPTTATKFVKFREMIFGAFPNGELTIEDQIAQGDMVATWITFRGTNIGAVRGLPATGMPAVFTGVAIDRIENGKVVEMWPVASDLGMLHRLRVVRGGE